MDRKRKVGKLARGSRQGTTTNNPVGKRQRPQHLPMILKNVEVDEPLSGGAGGAVIERLKMKKIEEERLIEFEKLNKIYENIGKLYENAGFPGNVKATKDEELAAKAIKNKAPNHDALRKTKLKQSRKSFLAVVKNFSVESTVKLGLIQEFDDWLARIDIGQDLKTEADYENLEDEHLESRAEINSAFSHAYESIVEIKRIGYQLLEDAGYLDKDDDVTGNKQKVKRFGEPPEKIIDTEALLTDTSGDAFKEATSEIKRVMQDTIRLVKTPKAKTMVRGGLKQYKNLIGATERKMDLIVTLENDILDKDFKYFKLETESEGIMAQLEQVKNEVKVSEKLLKEKSIEMEKTAEENKDLKKKSTELEKAKAQLEDTVSRIPSRRSVVAINKKPTPEPKVQFVESPGNAPKTGSQHETGKGGLASSLLKEEVKQFRAKVDKLESEIQSLSDELTAEKEKSLKLQEELEESQNAIASGAADDLEVRRLQKKIKEMAMENENLEKQTAELVSELAAKDEIVFAQEKKILMSKVENPSIVSLTNLRKLSTSNAVVREQAKEKPQKAQITDQEAQKADKKLRRSHDYESSRLQDHVEREKQRHEAAIRKLEQKHKEYIVNIHKETIHLLRAINRFKETVAQILDKEDLAKAAFEVKELDNLPTDLNPKDHKLSLLRISTDAVEMLVAIESKLSQALMDRRLELKNNAVAKNMTSKDLDTQIELTTRLRIEHNKLIEKQNATKVELANAQASLKVIQIKENMRYGSVCNRYKVLCGQFNSLQRELHNLKKDFLESMKKKEHVYKSAVMSKRGMVKVIEEQQEMLQQMDNLLKMKKEENVKKFATSLKDTRRNLIQLEKALRDHRISRDMYRSAVEVLDRAKRIPVIRLYHILARYIAFRKLNRLKEVIKGHIADAKLDRLEVCAMKYHLIKVERQINDVTKSWQDETSALDKERRSLYSDSNKMFTEVVTTTQLLKAKPVLKPLPQIIRPHVQADFAFHIKPKASSGVTFPRLDTQDTVMGQKIAPIQGDPSQSDASVWKPFTLPSVLMSDKVSVPTIIEVPKMLDYEVNKSFKQAQKQLKKTIKDAYPMSCTEIYDFDAPQIVSLANRPNKQRQHQPLLRSAINVMIPSVGTSDNL